MTTAYVSAEKSAPLNPNGVAPVMVHVTAPADLPEGYTFEANLNGDPNRTFTVQVPTGGVKEGQIFLSPISNGKIGPHLNIPTGAWKDGLFGFCNNGPCHPSLWCAMICPQILMGQIMMRMQLTWLGEPGAMISTQYTFRIVAVIVSCYFIYSTCLEIYSRPYDVNTMPGYIPVLKALGAIMFSIWALYSLCRTRENIRARYSIPEQHCKGCEDIVCATFCGCCTVAQLARHSGDYENHAGACCTQTGHPFGTPLAV